MYHEEIPIIDNVKIWFIPYSRFNSIMDVLYEKRDNDFQSIEREEKFINPLSRYNIKDGDIILTKSRNSLIISRINGMHNRINIELIIEVPLIGLNLFVKDKIYGLRKVQEIREIDSYIISMIYPVVLIDNRLVISLKVNEHEDIQAKKLGELISYISDYLIQETEINENDLFVKINVNSPGTILLIAKFAVDNSDVIIGGITRILPLFMSVLGGGMLLIDVYERIKGFKRNNNKEQIKVREISDAIILLVDAGYTVTKNDK